MDIEREIFSGKQHLYYATTISVKIIYFMLVPKSFIAGYEPNRLFNAQSQVLYCYCAHCIMQCQTVFVLKETSFVYSLDQLVNFA
ncbi:hypothetical protein FKM82_023819 [Ascaphus truei]